MSPNLKFSFDCFAQSSYFPPVCIIFHITERALLCVAVCYSHKTSTEVT